MTPLRQRICAALFGLCLSLCALVAPVAQAAGAPDASPKSPSWLAPKSAAKPPQVVAGAPRMGLGRSLIALLSISVLGGTALYLRSKKKRAPQARLAQLRVVGATKLGGRAQLVLAEVNGRQILLGVTDASVRKLGWMDAEAAEEEEELSPVRPRLVASGVDLGTRASRAVAEAAPAPSARKRTFRDLLVSAVGNLGSRSDDDSAALTLAAETHDTFTRTAPRSAEKRSPEAPRKNGNPQMIDLEGQAKGLLARLGEPRG
ncbi:MAG TPA: flagellar biosynthetic protein FliO [Polyangiaceae bacterium]|jgi:flagellar biogenesis protein FliO|nr:flagellar biosynthetic protein FliO [Polyangiaceae bacterium]